MRIRLALVTLVVTVIAAACGGETESTGVAREVAPLPAPSTDVVLTVVGAVGQPNVGDEVHADGDVELLDVRSVDGDPAAGDALRAGHLAHAAPDRGGRGGGGRLGTTAAEESQRARLDGLLGRHVACLDRGVGDDGGRVGGRGVPAGVADVEAGVPAGRRARGEANARRTRRAPRPYSPR